MPISTALLSTFHFSALADAPVVYVYDSFGAGNTFSYYRWVVAGSSAGFDGYLGHAQSFVPDISGNLNQVQLATAALGLVPQSNFYIAQDNGNGIPGAVLENFKDVPVITGVITINSVTTPLLQAGQKYWLCDEPSDSSSFSAWCFNNQGITGNYAHESSEWAWNNLSIPNEEDGVFSISVVPIPEPSCIALVLLGIGQLAARGRRRSPSQG